MQDENAAWRAVADAAQRMLSGELPYLDGARIILAQRHQAALNDTDPDLVAFILIESETDHLPVGSQRAYWSDDALRAKEPDIIRAETWARKTATPEAERLLARFARRAGEADASMLRGLVRRRVYFDTYQQRIEARSSALLRYRIRVTCPCCGYPTLDGRANYEICFICWWEDDGQDDDTSEHVRGGPNHGYSLREARANFARHGVMYAPDRDLRRTVDSPAEILTRRQIIGAFEQLLETSSAHHDPLWQVIHDGERTLKLLLKERRSQRQRTV